MGSGDGNPPGPQVSRCCQIRAPSQGTCLEISRMKTSSPPRQNRSHLVAQVSELIERCLLVLLVHTAASTPGVRETLAPTPAGTALPRTSSGSTSGHLPLRLLSQGYAYSHLPERNTLRFRDTEEGGNASRREREWRTCQAQQVRGGAAPTGRPRQEEPVAATGSHCRALNHRHLARSFWDTFHNWKKKRMRETRWNHKQENRENRRGWSRSCVVGRSTPFLFPGSPRSAPQVSASHGRGRLCPKGTLVNVWRQVGLSRLRGDRDATASAGWRPRVLLDTLRCPDISSAQAQRLVTEDTLAKGTGGPTYSPQPFRAV